MVYTLIPPRLTALLSYLGWVLMVVAVGGWCEGVAVKGEGDERGGLSKRCFLCRYARYYFLSLSSTAAKNVEGWKGGRGIRVR